MTTVHLHAATGPCRTECGQPCDPTTAHRALNPERVTCPTCLAATPRG